MAPVKCCVSGCSATSDTHRLYNLPRNDNLRSLWMSFLVPTNPNLLGLSKEQLLGKRVCHQHFDRYQFDGQGKRIASGYPSLFSSCEIAHGIPLSADEYHVLSEHNYHKTTNNDDAHDANEELLILQKQGDEHTYTLPTSTAQVHTSTAQVHTSTAQGHTSTAQGHTSTAQVREEPSALALGTIDSVSSYQEIPSCSYVQSSKITALKISTPKDKESITKSTSKQACFIQNMKRKSKAVNKKIFIERLAEARNLSQDNSFINNFSKLPKQAQTFLKMQLKSVNKKKKAMRFSNEEKLLSLTFMKESPKGYRLLQKIFRLPTKRTLNRFAENINFDVGINKNLFKLIQQKATKWDTKKKLCSIIFDEVALTPHLTYVESKDEIIGLKDLGEEKEFRLSDHALVFMLRGVCSKWKQPISYYFCEGTTSSAEVMRILKEVVAAVSETGLIPIALVCDQGSTFRSAIKMFKQETRRKKQINGEDDDGTIEISGQNLSVVFDPPHLLKGLRNNFLTKNIIFNGKIATWQDILTVYNNDCQLGHTRMNKKLTEHHVIPDKIKKMKVSVAAQVFSQQTSAVLKYTSLFTTTVEGERVSKTMGTTADAVEFFDKLFDSVNGSKGSAVKGKLRGPIKANSEHFQFWHEAKDTLKSMKFVDSTSKRALLNKQEYYVRVPSLEGWITSLESFERIAKLLFNKYNLTYFYPRNINQDPLENFFGRIRAINYRNVNPDCYTFMNSFKSLLISNVMGPHSIYSNCEDDGDETIVDFVNLLRSDNDKENVIIQNFSNVTNSHQVQQHSASTTIASVIKERVRVHSAAYTAGYLCRRITSKLKCKSCKNTYLADKKENIHEWISQREYKTLKNSNLVYPSKQFLIMYRDFSDSIHQKLNELAHKKEIGKIIKNNILTSFDLNWLGCSNHKTLVINFLLSLILRIHVHNWCNIMNKILRGDFVEKCVKNMSLPQIMAYNKYKTYRLRNKK